MTNIDESRSCLWWLLVFATTLFLLLQQHNQLCHTHSHQSHYHGTPTNVTKNLYFPNFNSNPYPQDNIKLLGSAKVLDGIIQIPNASSPTIDPKHKAG